VVTAQPQVDPSGPQQPLGSLAGVPVAIKDVLCHQGVTTTCSSQDPQNFVPAVTTPRDRKLKQADGY